MNHYQLGMSFRAHNNNMVVVTLLLTVVLKLNFWLGQTLVTDIIHDINMAGKACTNSSVVLTQHGLSVVQCAALCGQNAGCKSIFYKKSTMSCMGCDSIFSYSTDASSLPDDAGTDYYRPYALYGESCSDNEKPCIEQHNVCFPGLEVCVCDPAANYDPTSGSCVTGCDTYGSTYQKYPLHVLTENNEELQGDQYNVTDCLVHCTESLYACYGVDYGFTTHICYYNSQNAYNTTAWQAKGAIDAYVRNCA